LETAAVGRWDILAAGMERTLTLAEAADATGLTRKALQRRVDRGSLRSVLIGGLRRVPVSELYRAGLLTETGAVEGDERSPSSEAAASPAGRRPALDVGELLDRLERQARELGEMRALTRQAESLQAQAEGERAARRAAEAALLEARARITQLESARGGGVGAAARELAETAWRAWRVRGRRRGVAARAPSGRQPLDPAPPNT
jgi:excisionase family DNA binding protein